MTDMRFNELPRDVQEKVKETLRCYPNCYVEYEYGEYHVSVGCGVYGRYAPDHKFIGRYKDKEVFTEKERILNYVNEFNSYPIEYKGKEDYALLRKAWDEKRKFKFDDNGDLVLE